MNHAPVNVLYVTAYGSMKGGGERYLVDVIRHLDRTRFHPVVVTPQSGSLVALLESLGAETFVFGANYGGHNRAEVWHKRLAETRQQVHRIAKLIREKGIGLVHTNNHTRLEGAFAARIVGVPHVYLAHVPRRDEGFYRWLQLDQSSFAALMGELSYATVAVSGSVAGTLAPPLPFAKVRVIHNGIDFERFDAAARRASADLRGELGIPPESVVVMAVGRIDQQKGFDILVEAALRTVPVDRRTHFAIVGADTDRRLAEKLRSDVASAGLNSNIHFLGFRDDVPALLGQAEIFALTSRFEGHPYVLLEAMAAGCAVVASRCAGVEETVEDQVSALLTDVGDVDATARAITSLVRDESRRTAMAQASAQRVRECFDVRRTVASLMSVYEEALAAECRSPGAPLIDLFLDTAHDLGSLGLRVAEMERRIRKLEESLPSRISDVVSRAARRATGLWRRSESSDES